MAFASVRNWAGVILIVLRLFRHPRPGGKRKCLSHRANNSLRFSPFITRFLRYIRGMDNLNSKQLASLGLIIAVSGAGGSLLARAPSSPASPAMTHVAVLREEQQRQERRIDLLTRRVRALEVQP
jgi:hypothetical protein